VESNATQIERPEMPRQLVVGILIIYALPSVFNALNYDFRTVSHIFDHRLLFRTEPDGVTEHIYYLLGGRLHAYNYSVDRVSYGHIHRHPLLPAFRHQARCDVTDKLNFHRQRH